IRGEYPVLAPVSRGYPRAWGRLPTCYSPVRRSPLRRVTPPPVLARLACVRRAASVRPEPGSNSQEGSTNRPRWPDSLPSLESDLERRSLEPNRSRRTEVRLDSFVSPPAGRREKTRPPTDRETHWLLAHCSVLKVRATPTRKKPPKGGRAASW